MGDGRRVDEIAAAPPGTAPAPPPYGFNAPMATLGPPQPVGFNWVALARWITIGLGAFTVLGLVLTGLVVQYITVPVQDPNTGRFVDETLNMRPILLIAAILAGLVFALFAWLTGYAVMRVIFLVLIAIAAVSAIARLGGEPSSAVAATMGAVVFDVGFGFVLMMSLLAPQRPAA
jgi:hypothetical protein